MSIINQLKFEIDNINIHGAKPVLKFKVYMTHIESLHLSSRDVVTWTPMYIQCLLKVTLPDWFQKSLPYSNYTNLVSFVAKSPIGRYIPTVLKKQIFQAMLQPLCTSKSCFHSFKYSEYSTLLLKARTWNVSHSITSSTMIYCISSTICTYM